MGGPCSDCCFAACTRSTQEPPRKVEPDLRMNLRTRSENPAQLTLRALVGSEPPPVASQDGHSRTHPRRSCSGSSARWRARNAGRPVIASIHIEAVQQRVFANSVELGKPTLELERLARRSDLDIQGTPRRGRFQEIDPDQRLMWRGETAYQSVWRRPNPGRDHLSRGGLRHAAATRASRYPRRRA
jgi:hypothetical protein